MPLCVTATDNFRAAMSLCEYQHLYLFLIMQNVLFVLILFIDALHGVRMEIGTQFI